MGELANFQEKAPDEVGQRQRNILKVATEAGHRRMTPHDLAEQAGCSVSFLCEQLQDRQFRAMFNEAMQGAVAVEVPEILNTFAQKAKDGSFKHGKLILEVAGAYSEKSEVNINANITHESPFGTEEERKAFLEASIARIRGENEGEIIDVETQEETQEEAQEEFYEDGGREGG